MIEAVVYLQTRALVNRGRQLQHRLKSPRYAIALLLGAGYLAMVFFGQPQANSGALPPRVIEWIGTLGLALFALKWWVFGADRTALAFTPAEIQFLFPAPVSRRALLGYKLARAQVRLLLSVLIWTVLLHRHGPHSLAGPLYAAGLWGLLTTVFLHRLGVALTRDAAVERGWQAWRRVLPVILVLGACVVIAMRRAAVAPDADLLPRVRLIAETAPLAWLLWPFHLVMLPLSALNTHEWAPRFAAVLGLLLLHLLWILRADVAFEDAALEATARRAALLERWRRQGGTAPLTQADARTWRPLAPSGHPGRAILWKNLTRLVRTVSPGLPLIMIALMVGGLLYGMANEEQSGMTLGVVAGLALSWAGMLTLLGPQWIRNDLRGELDQLALLRTWPVSGLVVMTSEVASSSLVLTGLQAVFGLGGLAALALSGAVPVSSAQLLGLTVPGVLFLLAVNVIAMAIQNAGALLYPSWVRTELRPGGVEMMGQQFLTAGASLLLLAVALLGPGLLGGGLGYLLWPHLGPWSLGPVALLATAGLALEAFLILDWLGTRFEQFDPTAAN
jgi:hypothetical protein